MLQANGDLEIYDWVCQTLLVPQLPPLGQPKIAGKFYSLTDTDCEVGFTSLNVRRRLIKAFGKGQLDRQSCIGSLDVITWVDFVRW